MIDFHSHILPSMDDGSSSVKETLELLGRLSEQHIDTVAATPHFIADRESIQSFISRRAEALARVREYSGAAVPDIRLGAEVAFYDGISMLEGLENLCLEGTDILLLEMPCSKWSSYTVRELYSLTSSGTVTVMLAHIERCLFEQSPDTLEHLLDDGVIMQSNASFFINRLTRRKACSMLKGDLIHVIGSDCHNITARPPRIGEAYEIIEKRLGAEVLHRVESRSSSLIG